MQISAVSKGNAIGWMDLSYSDQGPSQLASLLHQWQNNSNYDSIEALVWDRADDVKFCDELARHGFSFYLDKTYVGRDLAGWRPPYKDHLEYQSLRAAGEEAFLLALEHIYTNLTHQTELTNPREDFEFSKAFAGASFNPDHWQLAMLKGQTAGVVYPHIYEDETHKGTLLFIGVVAGMRGRGIGKLLHAAGLNALKQMGAARYVGSTEMSNTRMLNLFRTHGCDVTGVRKYFRKSLITA